MIKKIIFLLIFVTILIPYVNTLAEDIILTTFYPAPWGAYKQMAVGPGTVPPETIPSSPPETIPSSGTSTQAKKTYPLMRIGVQDVTVPEGTYYVPALLEVGGIPRVPNDMGNLLYFGLYSEGQIGICGVSSDDYQPAIVGYKPLIGENPAHAPAIVGMGSQIGVEGEGTGCGVRGITSDITGNERKKYGVYGEANPVNENDSYGYGVYGKSSGDIGADFFAYGVYGESNIYGVYGKTSNVPDNSNNFGVYGDTREAESGTGVYGVGYIGVRGVTKDNLSRGYAIYGEVSDPNNSELYAGYFVGNVYVRGNLDASQVSANIKNFVIEHPINKDMLLRHSCIEGPEAGIYQRGRVKLENKEAIIELPHYFKALCKDTPTISLTPVSELALVSYKELEKGKRYKIFSDKDNIEVDWIIVAKREGIIVEEEKHEE